MITSMTDEPEHRLTEVLKELQHAALLRDSDGLAVEVPDLDPLSPQGLGDQTQRLIRLIKHAREADDAVLARSLRRELLLTRWAMVRSMDGIQPPRPSPGAPGPQAPKLDRV